MVDPQRFPLTAGSHGVYEWLVTDHKLDDFLRLCPAVVLGKYAAVTSWDSGSLSLNDVEKSAGWESRKGIAYSPRIQSVGALPMRGGYDEWYLFGSRVDLGELGQGNVFEAPLSPGQVWAFVNYADGFALHNPSMQGLVALFWRQLEWILPESFISDSDAFLTFVSVDRTLFAAVRQALSDRVP